jgi:hypothetical protein
VRFPGTAPCFTCGSDSRTSLCGANSSPPPASKHIFVRGLAVLTPASFPPGLAAAQLPSSDALVLDSCIEHFQLLGHPHVGHTQAATANSAVSHASCLRTSRALQPHGRLVAFGII